MSARILFSNESKPEKEAINEIASVLNNGGLAVFPTETVYGIGVDAFNEEAVKALYEKKQRPYDKPLLMHIYGIEMAESVAILDDRSRELIRRFTPGPLTLVVKKKSQVPSVAVSGGETVGLRFPSNNNFIEISKAFNRPIAATSANISGEKSATDSSGLESVKDIADIILDGGESELGLESTIVSLVGETPKILRLGSFPKEKIEEVLGKCD